MSTTAADVRAVCETCSEIFHPRSHGQRFCSRRCVDASRRVPRTCQLDGCDAPPRSHGAKHCQVRADDEARAQAARIAQQRKASLPRVRPPTEAQIAAFLSNRDRPDSPAERDQARFELALLERARVDRLATLSNATHAPTGRR